MSTNLPPEIVDSVSSNFPKPENTSICPDGETCSSAASDVAAGIEDKKLVSGDTEESTSCDDYPGEGRRGDVADGRSSETGHRAVCVDRVSSSLPGHSSSLESSLASKPREEGAMDEALLSSSQHSQANDIAQETGAYKPGMGHGPRLGATRSKKLDEAFDPGSTDRSSNEQRGETEVSRAKVLTPVDKPAECSSNNRPNYTHSTSMGEITEYIGTLCQQLQCLHQALQAESSPGQVNMSDGDEEEGKDLIADYTSSKMPQGKVPFPRSQSLPWVDNRVRAEDLFSGIFERRGSRNMMFDGMPGYTSNGMRSSVSPSASQRLSTQTMLTVQKFLQNPGVKGWSVISSLPGKITFCQPVTCLVGSILYVCGRCVQKPGGPESAVLWEVTFSEYTALNWEESSLPSVSATDCLAVFYYNSCIHVVLIGEKESDSDGAPYQVLAVWRRGATPSPPIEGSVSARHPHHANTLHNTKKKVTQNTYDWILIAERKWNVYQFTTVPHNDFILFAGGRSGAGRSKAVRALDLTTKEWSDLPALPVGICGATGVVWKGQILVIGGFTGRGLGTPQCNVYALDMESTQARMWYSTSYAKLERGGCGAIAVRGEVLIVAGSQDASHKSGDEVQVLSEDGRFWFSLASFQQRRCSPVLAFIGNRLLCFGGENGASLRTSIEALDLSYFHLDSSSVF